MYKRQCHIRGIFRLETGVYAPAERTDEDVYKRQGIHLQRTLKSLYFHAASAAEQIADGALHIIDRNRMPKRLSLIHIYSGSTFAHSVRLRPPARHVFLLRSGALSP